MALISSPYPISSKSSQAAPLTDPITADLTASSGWVAKAPSTWKSHWSIDPSVFGTGSCPENIGKFGGALNLLGLFTLIWLAGGV